MLQYYCSSLTDYKRLPTRAVKIGNLAIGNNNPIRIQTMTTTDTMDTAATVAQCIRCIEAGAELVRITAPSKKEAENLANIKQELRRLGYQTPLIADIHFTPNAAEIAAGIVEKVRINPGNYIDKKKFDFIEYTDHEYNCEIEKIRDRFTPLVRICKENGTAMRIGTNHGSLSDRIMSRYGDSPIGMVESAMEFLRICRDENYHSIILSMKSSNPLVMVQAYRLLVQKMYEEFNECYPLHIGVTEAGDGEAGRIKSAIGIGTLLEDGIGDTIRVSLTEDPEFEIPVCKDIVNRYSHRVTTDNSLVQIKNKINLPYNPFAYKRRESTISLQNEDYSIGSKHVPVVIADYSNEINITPDSLNAIGYYYDIASDKWKISDGAADYIYTGDKILGFELPGTVKILCQPQITNQLKNRTNYFPVFTASEFMKVDAGNEFGTIKFVVVDVNSIVNKNSFLNKIKQEKDVVVVLKSNNICALMSIRSFISEMMEQNINCPIIIQIETAGETIEEQLIHYATEAGGLLLDGMGDGLWFINQDKDVLNRKVIGRTYMEVKNKTQFLNNTAFSILQATRTRISKTEYISCPSCGRTLFDLQETTAKIRSATQHLKGVKIAIMGCIVNGPGEMADADFGYVGSGPGKITLYKGKDVIKKNVPSNIAVDELIQLLKDNEAWVEITA